MFLDFEGVLHPEFCHESRHFECVHHLANACGERDDLDIVISSTWRLSLGPQDLQARFPKYWRGASSPSPRPMQPYGTCLTRSCPLSGKPSAWAG